MLKKVEILKLNNNTIHIKYPKILFYNYEMKNCEKNILKYLKKISVHFKIV